MFKLTRIPIVPVRREAVRLPITITLGVPDDDCVDRVEHVFNVPGAIHHLIGGAAWERATQAIQPLVWAPSWSDARLAAFVTRKFPRSKRPFPASAVQRVRAYDLLPSASPTSDYPHGAREILHLLASFDARDRREPELRLGRRASNDAQAPSSFGAIRDALVTDNTRLLILQVIDLSPARALQFGARIVGSGGPATLVVSGGAPATLDQYFLGLYANLVHNFPLPLAASRPSHAGLDVVLILGKGAEDVLQLHRWLDQFRDDLQYLKTANAQLVRGAVGADLPLLHVGQLADLKRIARLRVTAEAPEVAEAALLDALAGKIEWARESTGLLPLSNLAQVAPRVEWMARRYREIADTTLASDLKAKSQEMVLNAPRVLNANFGVPGQKRPLDPRATLRRGRRYDLLVDVGPRWNTIPSLVQGSAGFPEAALPPSGGGHPIRVAFFSDDFGPAGVFRSTEASEGFSSAVASADLWLPPSGRSHPLVAGRPSKRRGPARLPIVLRKRGQSRSTGVARGRLSVYYAGNLLQSAMVTVNVAGRTGKGLDRRPNTVTVDYVFSGSFADIGQYETRDVGDASPNALAVGLNIAMNGDGAAGHRIMIAGHDDLTISRPYDPLANKRLLEKTRLKLRECFSMRDTGCLAQGSPDTWTAGLDKNNGKTLAQFKCDLWQLAWHGSDLYTRAFGQLSLPGLIPYLQKLQKALASRTVIQVARTSAAQYVFPWALVYDIPLPDRTDPKKLGWCPSIQEWDSSGRRTQPAAAVCPYQDTPAHQKNMLCPYGFWGLKHVIEQPINVDATDAAFAGGTSVMPDVAGQVVWHKPPAMSVGITRDATLDADVLSAHFKAMEKVAACSPDGGAETWAQVQTMLASPDIVYFLCHGEFDTNLDEPYIGIGPRDADYTHRVYPDQLLQWARTVTDFWIDRHPLVFINGCHTADLVPDQILNFVNTFAGFGAGAVVGTEISIRLPLAVEVAENFFRRMAVAETIGGATYALRWDLANKGNLLGLAYTPYGLSSLRFQ